MTKRNSSKRHLTFEALEVRDTPSVMMGGIHTMKAPPHRPVGFSGSGSATLTGETILPNGGLQVAGSVVGQASLIKQFTGTIDGTFSPGFLRVTATAELQAVSNGDKVDIALSERLMKSGKNGHFSGNFTITGGTGRFAHATGGGSISNVFVISSNSASIRFSGRVRL